MDNVKISVTFELPGSQMLTSQECEENPNLYEINNVSISLRKRVDKKHFETVKENIRFKTRGCKPAKQVFKMSKEAYLNMISNTPIPGIPPSTWNKMKKVDRVCAHLDKIKEDLQAKSYTFNIFGD